MGKVLAVIAGLIVGFLWTIVGSFYFLLCGQVGCENIRYLVMSFPAVFWIMFLLIQPLKEFLRVKVGDKKFPLISYFIISAGLMSLWYIFGDF